jgi:predicted metal-dependent peptidase
MTVTALESAIMRLINQDRFYAEVILQMVRIPDSKIPTAGVSVSPRVTLRYHPELFEKNSAPDNVAILKHEVGHLILNHLQRSGNQMSRIQNVAADLAVNSFIPELQHIRTLDPDGRWTLKPGCTVDIMQKDFPELEVGKTYEWYLEVLKKNQEKCPDSSDDHSQWGQSGELDEYLVKDLIQKAVDRTVRGGQKVPDGIRDLVKQLLKPSANWARELQRFPQDAEKMAAEDTWRRRNRRLGLRAPGQKAVRKTKIGVAIDVSGSVDGPLLDRFFAECSKIDQVAEVVAIFFDHGVQKVCSWAEVKKLAQIPGGGGTCFQPMLDEGKRLKLDGLVVLTDGQNFDTIVKPSFPVMWAIPANYEMTQPFGKHIRIQEDR